MDGAAFLPIRYSAGGSGEKVCPLSALSALSLRTGRFGSQTLAHGAAMRLSAIPGCSLTRKYRCFETIHWLQHRSDGTFEP
jgi:hypothetical protein